MSSLCKKYGKVFSFFAFTRPYLIISDPLLARRILTDPKVFIKGDIYTKYFSLVFGQGLVTSNNEKHHVDKILFSKFFHKSRIIKYIESMNRITVDAFHNLLETKSCKISSTDSSYDLEKFFGRITLRIFTNFAYTDSLPDADEEEICHNISRGRCPGPAGCMLMLMFPLKKSSYFLLYIYDCR